MSKTGQAKLRATESAADIYERLDKISRIRALADDESLALWKAIRAMKRTPRTAVVKKPDPVKGPPNWSSDADARFFDAIADGMTIAAAGRLVGKSNAASQGRFNRVRKALGSLAA